MVFRDCASSRQVEAWVRLEKLVQLEVKGVSSHVAVSHDPRKETSLLKLKYT